MSMIEIWRQLARRYAPTRQHADYRGRNPADVLADPEMTPTRGRRRAQACPCGGIARPGDLYCGEDRRPSGGIGYTGSSCDSRWYPDLLDPPTTRRR